jgi:DNA-binding MarR family transcriptional regulator
VGKGDRSTPEKQTLILWALLARDNAAGFQSELKPEPDKADRDALEKAGLIKSKRRGRYRRIWIEVTEKGWARATDHLNDDLPTGSPAGSSILQAWLTRLKAYMQARNVPLAEILGPQRARKDSSEVIAIGDATPASGYDTLRSRIRQAYLAVTGGRINTRARLCDIREKLNDIDRAALDEALKRMQLERQASLYPLDNKTEITDADRNAAIYFGAEPRHILWIER